MALDPSVQKMFDEYDERDSNAKYERVVQGELLDLQTNIRRLRLQKGMTLESLAIRMNGSNTHIRNNISRWERGETVPNITSVARLAVVLKVSIKDLLTNPTDIKAKSDTDIDEEE